MFQHLFDSERARREAMTAGQVVPDPVRCVQWRCHPTGQEGDGGSDGGGDDD